MTDIPAPTFVENLVGDWPLFFRDTLTLGRATSPVSICTLWTKQEKIADSLSREQFCVVGNLYSRDGVNYILRNVLANPQIRYIVLCGADRSGSGETLSALFANGIDDDHNIRNDVGRVESELPADQVELVRRAVRLIELRGEMDPQKIAQVVAGLDQNLPPFADPRVFPRAKPRCEIFPSEENAIVVRGRLVVDVWLQLLKHIMTFGRRVRTEYSVDQRELQNVVAVVTDEDPNNIFFADFLPFARTRLQNPGEEVDYLGQLNLPWESIQEEGLDGYYVQVLTPKDVRGLEYTYGQRLYAYGKRLAAYRRQGRRSVIDQIGEMIAKLKETSYSRRAVGVLWDPYSDAKSSSPPCLTLVQAMIRDAKLNLTAYVRSHDIYRAWPENAFALRKLQRFLADGCGVTELGNLTIISNSAHVYEDSWDSVNRLLDTSYNDLLQEKEKLFARRLAGADPRGNFVIRIEGGAIIVDHHSSDGNLLQIFSGHSAKAIEKQVVRYVSEVSHALYLGRELAKAEICLKTGMKYIQDRDIRF